MRKMVFAVVTAVALAGLSVDAPASARSAPHKLGGRTELDQCTINLARSHKALTNPLSPVEVEPVYLTANC